MKALKRSHREKKRYVLIEGRDVTKENIEEAILDFVGIFGYAEASPLILKTDKNRIVMSINREMLDKIRTSFLLSKKELRIVKVSGSLKNLLKKFN